MPKISIALSGRNDSYGGNDYLDKVKLSILSLQRALDKVDYEIVLVDYNPPTNKPLLSEIFLNKDYPKIKHIIFSNEEHKEFIDCHLKNGAKLVYKDKVVNKKRLYNISFISIFAAGVLAIKYSSGDYILSTGIDNIFPIQFGEFIDKLEPNVLYRTWMYRMLNSFKKIKNFPIEELDEISRNDKPVRFEQGGVKFKKEITIWNSAGNFLLMDKKSWEEIGGHLPLIDPRPPLADCQVVFHALVCGKKIKCASFPIFNIHRSLSLNYRKLTEHSNYVIEKRKIKYNHVDEIGVGDSKTGTIEWRKFRKFAMKNHLKPDKEYFIKLSYKKRFKEIKRLFSLILPKKFLI